MSKTFNFKPLSELSLLLVITLAIHGLVLYYIFPKYYDPLWPHHSDFYIPSAIAHSPQGLSEYIRYPRPIGMVFFYIIGQFGTRGAIAAVILVTALNCAITSALFRRAARIPFGLPFLVSFILYLYLLFSAPGFYIFYTHDAFAQLSYFLLALGCWGYYKLLYRNIYSALFLFFLFNLAAFLSKETYILSIGLIAIYWFFTNKKSSLIKATFPIIGVFFALATIFIINYINKSPFTSGTNSAYQISLNPISVMHEWYRYASEGLNLLSVAVLVLILYFTRNKSRNLMTLGLVCIGSGISAWLPNALLPNHHFTGYSWNGAYLLFLPILTLFPAYSNRNLSKYVSIVIVVIAALTPLAHKKIYKKNQWVLQQEGIQRNLLMSIAKEASKFSNKSQKSRILVTGIDFPFSPFQFPNSLKEFQNLRRVRFDQMIYPHISPKSHTQSADGVGIITPENVDFSRYDSVWGFGPDGRIVFDINISNGKPADVNFPSGASKKTILLYPKLYEIFSHTTTNSDTARIADEYLRCGQELIKYGNMTGAASCLSSAIKLIPQNPYPYFYMGRAQESMGQLKAALASYRKAVRLDNSRMPNPWFTKAIDELQQDERSENPIVPR